MPWRTTRLAHEAGRAKEWTRVIETLPIARQSYIVQVRFGPQSIVIGVVQPEAVMAVKVRIKPRTTLYFRPDMTTPSVGGI
jgi:hypothetical protein